MYKVKSKSNGRRAIISKAKIDKDDNHKSTSQGQRYNSSYCGRKGRIGRIWALKKKKKKRILPAKGKSHELGYGN